MGVRKRAVKQNKETTKNTTEETVINNNTNSTNKNETKLSLSSIANKFIPVIIFLAILFVIWLNLQLETTKRQLEIKTKEIITLKNKIELISVTNNNDSVSKNETDAEEFPELTQYIGKIKHGHNPEVTILFASEDTNDTKHQIISLAREVLYTKDLVNCLHRNDNAEFDVYKSCFRDISIELYNSIQTKFMNDWVVTAGVVDNCFMVTDVSYNHEEYFFHFDGKIYFEVFRLPDNVIKENIKLNNESVKNEQIDENGDQIKNERIQENPKTFDEVDEEEENEEIIAETNESETP